MSKVRLYITLAIAGISSEFVTNFEIEEAYFKSDDLDDLRVEIVSNKKLPISNLVKELGNKFYTVIVVPIKNKQKAVLLRENKLEDLEEIDIHVIAARLSNLSKINNMLYTEIIYILQNFERAKKEYIVNRLIAAGHSKKKSKNYAEWLYEANKNVNVF